MRATVNVVCYRSKTLSNGEHPLMIRVIKDRKIKYQSLGISVKAGCWNFNKNKPKHSCPNRDLILKIIFDKNSEYQKQILELKTENKEFTTSTLIPDKSVKTKTVGEFFQDIIEDFKLSNRVGNAKIYRDTCNFLKQYTDNRLDIPFSHIDINFLKGYEKWLKQKGWKETTISLTFRTIRSVYNKAIEAKYAKESYYPFKIFKVSKFNTSTEKRAISKDTIKKIIDFDTTQKDYYIQMSKDLFIFSYLCGGINFIDLANLTIKNIIDNRIIYVRQKTQKRINVPLNSTALSILKKHISEGDNYIFPILDNKVHITELQKFHRRHKVLSKVNKSLKKIAEELNIEADLTTYVARHSYATVLKNSGVSVALISETLGHSDLKTTQIYLDSFENSQIDKALENLL